MKIVIDRLSSQAKRDIFSFVLTVSVYLPLLFWWSVYASALVPPASQSKANELVLDISAFQKEVCPTAETSVKSEEMQKEELAEEKMALEPPLIPVPVKVLPEKPKPLIAKKVKTVKSKRSTHQIKKVSKKKNTFPTSRHSFAASSQKIGEKKVPVVGIGGKNQFIAQLKAKINAQKNYPLVAQKRGMEGSVSVRFEITSTGRLSGLTASGPRIFVNSAKAAVTKAFPLSTAGASLPMYVSLTLNYNLN